MHIFNKLNRREFMRSGLALGAGIGFQAWLPAWAQSGRLQADLPGVITGDTVALEVGESTAKVAGKSARHITINGQFPAPLLRWREGDDLTIRVSNRLAESTSIHWHGILLPARMDGVPGVSYTGIGPGQEFTYRFALKQAGTYWYHSHSGLQEQSGHYGPIIIDPAGVDPVEYDREHVIVLSDWTFEDPQRVFAKLKKMSDNYNFQKHTLGDFFREVKARGFGAVMDDRLMWGEMRMSPTDIADVTGSTYTYLVNGHSPEENWTGLFNAGEKVRLRFINASAMSIFNVRIPGLPMTVVQADGQDVQPVETDEFQIGTAETFDVVVTPGGSDAYTIMCESNDRSGYTAATLAIRDGLRAPVPPLRPRPTLTMKDMGMGDMEMAGMDMAEPAMPGMDQGQMDHAAMNQASMPMDHSAMNHDNMPAAETAMNHDAMPMDHSAMDHSAMNHDSMPAMETAMNHDAMPMDHSQMDHGAMAEEDTAMPGMDHAAMGHGDMVMDDGAMQAHNHPMGPGVANVAMNPVNRLHERPLGLENEPHRVLVYTELESLRPNPDARTPGRELELHLTSNMERYMWSFDGEKFSEVKAPIVFRKDERLRLTMVNDSMMPHPIHLHGMFFDVVTAEHDHKPRKHTIVIKPGEKMSVDITADAPGEWAFHCHLLYHMKAGMMRVVSVREAMS